jgi:hypothetical protein
VPRKQELCGANLYESSDKRKSANPAVTCSMSGVHCPVELTKVRQSMHRQAVLVFFARDVHFHQVPGEPFTGSLGLGTVCKSTVQAERPINGENVHWKKLIWVCVSIKIGPC